MSRLHTQILGTERGDESMHFLMFWQEEFVQQSRPFFVSDQLSSIQSHNKNDNLGIILQGEIGCLSLFGVKGSGKVNV